MRNFRLFRSVSTEGFSRIELVFVLAALFACVFVAVPLIAQTPARSDQIGCFNNLRQIGVAFQAWGNDHDDQRPWFVASGPPVNQGGTMGHTLRNNAWFHYTVLSNHLSPGALMDPAEKAPNKRRAQSWDMHPNGGFLNSNFRNNAASYMLSLHTSLFETHNILAADRHVQFGGPSVCPNGGITAVQWLAGGAAFRGWTNGPHGLAGNVLLNDGRVEYASQPQLRTLLTPPYVGAPSDHILTPF